MQVALRPYLTAGVAVAGASLIAVTPVVPPPLELQERAVQLSAAVGNGLAGLADDGGQVVNTISAAAGLVADPTFPTIVPVQVLTDASANLNHVVSLGPVILSRLIEAGLYPINAALAGSAGVTDNIVGDLTSANFPGALENVALAPSTVLGAFLNGYQGAPPFGSLPEMAGLLTNPHGAVDVSVGTIQNLLDLRETIATAITPFMPFTPTEPLFAADAGVPALAGALDPSTVAADLGTVLSSATADLSSMLNPADISGLFDPGAVTDIASMLSADLAPNLGGTLMDIPSMLLSLF